LAKDRNSEAVQQTKNQTCQLNYSRLSTERGQFDRTDRWKNNERASLIVNCVCWATMFCKQTFDQSLKN